MIARGSDVDISYIAAGFIMWGFFLLTQEHICLAKCLSHHPLMASRILILEAQ